ncbi:MAG: cupin domain-containing protein [Clostridiales bacterium]|nr:cupin domain-containing protein [Clostridiales bacterium]
MDLEIKEKPWGREIWYAVTDRYAGKILEVKAGQALSLQYHRRKKETLYVQEGKGKLQLGDEILEVGPGQAFTIEPGTIHRIEAITDLRILEVSTPELDDVVRLEDRYGRVDGTAARAPFEPVPEIYRSYDIRGTYGKNLTEEDARRLGWAVADLVREKGEDRVLLCRDARASSPALATALAQGLMEGGVNVLDLGEGISPLLYWAREFYGVDGAVMVTGSHNPKEENGFKVALGPGTLYGEAIRDLYFRSQNEPKGVPRGRHRFLNPIPSYVDMMAGRIQLERELHVVVDAGNGAAGPIAPLVYRRLGARVTELYCRPDPEFPHHHPDPVVPENLRDLQKKVVELGADVGLAFDGDGDRLGVVDDQGNILWGDLLMILFWREILPKYPGATALVEVKCSQALPEEIERLGGKPEFTRTGHSYVKARLRETGAPFAGEMSGHFFFADEYYGFDDAVYAGARLLRILSREGKKLSQLTNDIPRYPVTPETRVYCPEGRKEEVIEGIQAYFQGRYPLLLVDGVRVQFPGGWALVRASNTQEVLVLRAEGKTERDLLEIKAAMEEALRPYYFLGPIPW